MTREIDCSETKKIDALLIGRRIVSAGEKRVEHKTTWGYLHTEEVTYLELDDGTELHIEPNQGCGGCSSGYYWISSVAAFPNVITRVAHGVADAGDDEILTIHVYAEGASETVLSVSGSEGNGYYGRGYSIQVVRP